MYSFRTQGLVAATIVAAAILGSQASASVLTPGTGWVYDQIDAVDSPSENSPVTFTVGVGQTDIFSLVDGFNTGDIYTISGDASAVSSFSLLATNFPLGLGDVVDGFDSDWTDASYSRLQLTFLAGSYSLNIQGNGSGGVPAGFAYRLDGITSAVPLPAALPLFGTAIAGLGMVGRRRRRAKHAA